MAMSFDQAADMLRRASRDANKAPTASVRKLARDMRADVLSGWPSDSGDSAAGFRVTDDATGARLTNSVRHAFYVHEGLAHDSLSESESRRRGATVKDIERATTKLLEG